VNVPKGEVSIAQSHMGDSPRWLYLFNILTAVISFFFLMRELVGAGGAPSDAPRAAVEVHTVSSAAHCPPAPRAAADSVPALHTLFEFPPEVKRVIINVGSWLDPPKPFADDVATIAVEPNLNTAYNVRHEHGHKRMWVVTAAVADRAGFANFYTYNTHGVSSSLAAMSEANKNNPSLPMGGGWAQDYRREQNYPPIAFVPVLTLTQLINAVPPNITIIGLKTDLQGYDFVAISSAGPALQRVEQIFCEINCHGFAYNPDAPQNDYDMVWKDFMPSINFELDTKYRCGSEPAETNARFFKKGFAGDRELMWWFGDITGENGRVR
jgi:FkbM family methyltransferase